MKRTNFKYQSSKIDFFIRKSRLSPRIVACFKNNLGENFPHLGSILDKYAKIGMSRKVVQQTLQKLVGDHMTIKINTLDEAIKAEMAQGRTGFYFHAQQTGNPYHGNRGIERRRPLVPEGQGPIRIVNFKCVNCKNSHSKKIFITTEGYIKLAKRACPVCNHVKTLKANFRFDSKTIHKAIICGKEEFVTPKAYSSFNLVQTYKKEV